MSLLLKYFDVTFQWVHDKPEIKFLPKKNLLKTSVPKRPTGNTPYSSSEREYYTIFGTASEIDDLYEERRHLFPKTKLIAWYIAHFNLDDITIGQLKEYDLAIRATLSKKLKEHYASPAGRITKKKLKLRNEKWSPIISEHNRALWKNTKWVAKEMTRRQNSNMYERSSITQHKLYSTVEFYENFLKIMRNPDRIKKISIASKRNWQNKDYAKKVLGQARNKQFIVSGCKMNSIEAAVAQELDKNGVKWEYEFPITIGNKTFIPDFLIRDKNVIIEVHGDFWHANPNIYNENDLLYSIITAGTIWKRDAARQKMYHKAGYTVYTIWQEDINDNFTHVQELLNEIY